MKNHAIDGAQLGIQALETARRERIGNLTHDWLDAIGEDPNREGLQKTPQRVAKAWDFLTGGYRMDLTEVANEAVFAAEGSQMVVVKDIEFYSMCEHHTIILGLVWIFAILWLIPIGGAVVTSLRSFDDHDHL